MKVAIDVSPLQSDSRYRGIGSYTRNLIESLRALNLPDFSVETKDQPSMKIVDADVVHYPFFNPFAATIPFIKSRPTVITIHDMIPLVFPNNYPPGIKGTLNLARQKLSLKSVSVVITDSESSKRDIARYLSYPAEKISVIYLGVSDNYKQVKNSKEIDKITRKYGLPKDFVLYVGDVNYNKNLPSLVSACEKINTPLVIVGKQAVEKNYLRNHIENRSLVWLQDYYNKQKLPKILYLPGYIPDDEIAAVYSMARVYCQPSFYEGFGLSVLEAMACACPTVIGKGSSLEEIFGSVSIVFNPYSIEDMAGKINQVLKSGELSAKLLRVGKIFVKKFTWEETARKTHEVYKSICQ